MLGGTCGISTVFGALVFLLWGRLLTLRFGVKRLLARCCSARNEGGEGKDKDAKRAMDMFEQVQARKRDRIAMQQDQESERLGVQERSSERMVDTLLKVIESTDDDTVRMEAVKQLSQLRRADVEGTRASKDDSDA